MRPQSFLKTAGIFKSTSSLRTYHLSQDKPSHLIYCFPWHTSASQNKPFSSSTKKPVMTSQFFDALKEHKKAESVSPVLFNETVLKKLLKSINPHAEGNYLQDHFIHWLSTYAIQSWDSLQSYFSGQQGLTFICKNFIHFCFKNDISMDAHKTLQSFNYHNQLSDKALKQELIKITPKDSINILGFGLDEGHYEKTLAQFLIGEGITKAVNIFGFDPYALKMPEISYLTPEQLKAKNLPLFDVVVARWALHHVELQHRWGDFINCINRCNPDAMVLIVEHGFLNEKYSNLDKRLYYLFNATFDIIANIGLRRHSFTNTAPDFGSNFFIHYLEPEDFSMVKRGISLQLTQNIFDIGPGFPNQTICCMRLSGKS